MNGNQVSDVLAQAFAAEGVEVLFTLMGDANMYWSAAMADHQGVRLVHARHEHCACAMADAYARATGRIGVASVTCGPGYTQIMTALAMAARGNAPLVVFAGDAPLGASWYVQQIDQAPLALATGAHFVPIRTLDRALDNVREAFYVARAERRPVVLSVPLDLQKEAFPYLPDYAPSTDLVPRAQSAPPDPALVDEVVALIGTAERPVVIAGRGASWSGAKEALEGLAERSGALLATSLLGKGLFDGNPFSLDVAGTFSSDLAREFFAESDLVIGAGAGLGHYTTEGGYLYPNAKVVQIDTNPRGLWQGLRTADLHLRADARAAAEALVRRLDDEGIRRPGWRSNEIAARIAADVPDGKEFAVTPGTLDPRRVVRELDAAIPKDWDIVVAGGHCFNFAITHL
ncbi:MAG TPA: thiamine pyrophosphate-binding protein, partial [Stellaceae bacterium]|nr:thiamine pyrophosphate-binding protein [Stellaceae bacterium]